MLVLWQLTSWRFLLQIKPTTIHFFAMTYCHRSSVAHPFLSAGIQSATQDVKVCLPYFTPHSVLWQLWETHPIGSHRSSVAPQSTPPRLCPLPTTLQQAGDQDLAASGAANNAKDVALAITQSMIYHHNHMNQHMKKYLAKKWTQKVTKRTEGSLH